MMLPGTQAVRELAASSFLFPLQSCRSIACCTGIILSNLASIFCGNTPSHDAKVVLFESVFRRSITFCFFQSRVIMKVHVVVAICSHGRV